jgi:tRNA(Ile)-lysidine synthase
MFELLGKIPNILGVACSGGVDSLSIVHFLMQSKSREIHIHYLWHYTQDSSANLNAVLNFYWSNVKEYPNIKLHIDYLKKLTDSSVNEESYYHRQRYNFFTKKEYPIITGHHLDDQVENWIMTCLTGKPKLIPYSTVNVIRPFLLVRKNDFYEYAARHSICYHTDKSNSNLKYRRNRIRAQVTPLLHDIHPGLYKTIFNLIKAESVQTC